MFKATIPLEIDVKPTSWNRSYTSYHMSMQLIRVDNTYIVRKNVFDLFKKDILHDDSTLLFMGTAFNVKNHMHVVKYLKDGSSLRLKLDHTPYRERTRWLSCKTSALNVKETRVKGYSRVELTVILRNPTTFDEALKEASTWTT